MGPHSVVCRLWLRDLRPVHLASLTRHGMARRLSKVRRLSSVPGRVVHLLREGRQDLLQTGLSQVCVHLSVFPG